MGTGCLFPLSGETKSSGIRIFQSKPMSARTHSCGTNLLSSRLYCRLRSFTESCLAARGLYHRWGIAPRPEDSDSIAVSIIPISARVNCFLFRGGRTIGSSQVQIFYPHIKPEGILLCPVLCGRKYGPAWEDSCGGFFQNPRIWLQVLS